MGRFAEDASPEVNAVLRARLEQLMGDFEQVSRDLKAAQERMRTMTGTAETSDHTVRVEVDFRGNLMSLRLEPRAYTRYSPTLLAEQIVRLTKEAAADVTAQMSEVMSPFLPAGVSYADVLSGSADPSALTMAGPLTDETYDAWRAGFGSRSADSGT